MKIRYSVAVLSLLLTCFAHGQVGGDVLINGDVLPIIQNTSVSPYDVVVGVNADESGLLVLGGRSLTAGNVKVGLTSGSTSNWVELGDNSVLALNGALFLGYDSASNFLTTGDGAVIYTANGGVLGYTTNAFDNHAVVSGTNTVWISDGDLSIGYEGASNTLEVLDGAAVDTSGSLWVGVFGTATGNTMQVSASDVSVSNSVIVGYQGADNRLQLSNGATLTSMDGRVGITNNADNNVVLVSGNGSVWTNTGGLYIGDEANSGNLVSVTNYGAVVVYDELVINGTNAFNLDRDGRLSVLSDFDASMDGFSFNDGGSLYVGGALTGMTDAIDGGRSLGLVGGGALWDQSGSNIVVGGSTEGNGLLVEDGASVMADGLIVGAGDAAISNTVSVSGNGSLLDVSGDLSVGMASNADNMVIVADGGRIQLGGDLIMGGTSNAFILGYGGWLVASNGLDASVSGFDFQSGGTLESMGTLTGLNGAIEDGRTVMLTGSNAVWNLNTNILQVGYGSSSNALYVVGGASLISTDALLGRVGTAGNVVFVSGPGTVWSNNGDLSLEGFNSLLIENGGNVDVGGSLSAENGSALSFVSGGYASASNYYQDATSTFSFNEVTNAPSSTALLVVDDTAAFEGGATMEYTGGISGLERGVTYTNHLVDADTLIVDGVTNAADADLDALNIAGLGSLLAIDLMSENDDLIALITRQRLAQIAGFADGTDMAGVCDEVDQFADDGNPLADNMINTLTQLDSAEQHAQLSQLYDRHAPTHAHARGMMDGFSQARQRGVVPDVMLPKGAFGPHFYGSQVQGWIKGYGTWGQRDGSDAFSGYDQTTYGVLLGVDRSYGDLLAGIAGGRVKSDISQDDGDSSEATTGYGLLYASYGTVSWFGDLNIGYGRSTIQDHSGTVFNTRADYDANELGFYAGGGKEMVFQDDHLFITPSAALSGYYYLQDSYVERSTTALPRKVDNYDYLSMQSDVGLKVSYSHDLDQSSIVPEVHANWLHEFNADEERIDYSLVGGSGNYSFGMQSPVQDLYEVGLGLAWWVHGQSKTTYEWSAGLDGRFGDGYSESTVSLRLLSQF